MEELRNIQNQLVAPKGQFNSFGRYKYRSCEDILSAVKPLLDLEKCQLTLNDSVEYIGSRFYIKATATLTNANGESVQTTAYAREEEEKKGMDASQITGTASSYARKYALNGLFCIDDTPDADRLNDSAAYTEKPKKKKPAETAGFEVETVPAGDMLPKEIAMAIDNATTLEQINDLYRLNKGQAYEQALIDRCKARKMLMGLK